MGNKKFYYIERKLTIWEREYFTADEKYIPLMIEETKLGKYTKCAGRGEGSEYLYEEVDEINRKTIANEPTLKLYYRDGTLIAKN